MRSRSVKTVDYSWNYQLDQRSMYALAAAVGDYLAVTRCNCVRLATGDRASDLKLRRLACVHARHGLVVNGDVIYAWSAGRPGFPSHRERCNRCHNILRRRGGSRLTALSWTSSVIVCSQAHCTASSSSSSSSSSTDGSGRSMSEAQTTLRAACTCQSDAVVGLF